MTDREENADRKVREVLEKLTPLLGVWRGRGQGEFPTIDPFDYQESLAIRRIGKAPFLAYEQSTELIDARGRTIRLSHWETGLLRPMEDGGLELSCVQSGGRVEVLRGEFVVSASAPAVLGLEFHSLYIANDERVTSSYRKWSLTEAGLAYVHKMATSMVEETTLHLQADLRKTQEAAI